MKGKNSSVIKRIVLIIMVMCLCVAAGGCTQDEALDMHIDELEARAREIKTEICKLEAEREALAKEVTDEKIEHGTAKYVVGIKIKQKHYNLSIAEAIKDEANAIMIQIPVDKEFYESVEIGDVISDEFRKGSLWISGSFGRWYVTVEEKTIQ